MSKSVVFLVAAILFVSCSPPPKNPDGSDAGVSNGDLRVVAVDRNGECYIAEWHGNNKFEIHSWVKYGDCQRLLREGWDEAVSE